MPIMCIFTGSHLYKDTCDNPVSGQLVVHTRSCRPINLDHGIVCHCQRVLKKAVHSICCHEAVGIQCPKV